MTSSCPTENTDRLSHLPDPIRSHILSFLPMKDAIGTSILSRRWERTCYSVSNLDFDNFQFEHKKCKAVKFRDFVNEMVICHDGSDIRRFGLKVEIDGMYMSTRLIDTWISFAVDHNVQVFDLLIYSSSKLVGTLPRRFFTCNTLTTAILVNIVIILPSTVNFPALKSFTLENVIFHDEETFEKLISSSSCPVLEKLSISDCFLPSDMLFISNPSIKCLIVFDQDNQTIVDVPISTLQTIKCFLCKPSNLRFENYSTVSEANFQFFGNGSGEPVAHEFYCATKVMKELRNVETLSLQSGFIETLTWGRFLLPCLSTPCCSVRHLHIGMFSMKSHIQVIIVLLLKIYPNVQTLQIYVEPPEEAEWACPLPFIMEEHFPLNKSTPGALNCLQTVKIEKFQGSDCELELMNYLHDNAKVLGEINISYSKRKQTFIGREITKDMFSSFTKVPVHVSELP